MFVVLRNYKGTQNPFQNDNIARVFLTENVEKFVVHSFLNTLNKPTIDRKLIRSFLVSVSV